MPAPGDSRAVAGGVADVQTAQRLLDLTRRVGDDAERHAQGGDAAQRVRHPRPDVRPGKSLRQAHDVLGHGVHVGGAGRRTRRRSPAGTPATTGRPAAPGQARRSRPSPGSAPAPDRPTAGCSPAARSGGSRSSGDGKIMTPPASSKIAFSAGLGRSVRAPVGTAETLWPGLGGMPGGANTLAGTSSVSPAAPGAVTRQARPTTLGLAARPAERVHAGGRAGADGAQAAGGADHLHLVPAVPLGPVQAPRPRPRAVRSAHGASRRPARPPRPRR